MVILSSGIKLWLRIGKETAKEYHEEKCTSDEVETTTCFIEAKVGSTIRIFYNSLIVAAKDQEVILRLYMDGQKVSSTHLDYCRGASQKDQLYGKIRSKDVRQGLKFDKVFTTDDASLCCLSEEQLQDFCTIRIEISRVYIRKRNRCRAAKTVDEQPVMAMIHENSKPAQWGFSTQHGKLIRSSTTICTNVHEPIPNAITEVIIFKYRPYSWLVVNEICAPACREDDNEADDEVQTDEHRTEGAAIMQRAEERLNRSNQTQRENQSMEEEEDQLSERVKRKRSRTYLTMEDLTT